MVRSRQAWIAGSWKAIVNKEKVGITAVDFSSNPPSCFSLSQTAWNQLGNFRGKKKQPCNEWFGEKRFPTGACFNNFRRKKTKHGEGRRRDVDKVKLSRFVRLSCSNFHNRQLSMFTHVAAWMTRMTPDTSPRTNRTSFPFLSIICLHLNANQPAACNKCRVFP